jgi:indole-3-glycerol phosphate synthase
MSAAIAGLGEILARTRERVAARKRESPLERILASAPTPGARRSFVRALAATDRPNVIAEFKRCSPSRGVIREDLHPVNVAQAYEVGGAAALSVLTEEDFFGGSLDDLQQARYGTLLPTLCKDFIVDPYQVREAWIGGADAILLIMAALSDAEVVSLQGLALELGLDALVEVHDEAELSRALGVGARLIGVNNRDLRCMTVRLETSLELAERIPADVVAVAESGIRSGRDIARLRAAGYRGFLVGEHLMRAKDPGLALEGLLDEARRAEADR